MEKTKTVKKNDADNGSGKKTSLALLVAVYLAGIFMGAIDTGIVTPARTIIQNQLGVDEQTGIWMITIYTLAYAASIPIMGKLADKYGRKYIYLVSIFLFGLGSLFCGLSQSFDSFGMLLVARAIQAIGGGGIVPIATAEFGTSFPEEKRGVALGLIGGVYGIANIFGASAGSLILDIFGIDNWSYIFYINLPITAFIIAAGFFVLKNKTQETQKRLDVLGILTLTTMVLSLLYGLKNLDYFNLTTDIYDPGVYPYLLLFVGLLPVFIWLESRAHDPVMNLKYFTNPNIIITMLISLASGFTLMGVIFVPQFSENALKIATGSGGYLVMVLGLFAGIGAPLSGKLIDRHGVKLVLAFGFLISILGSLYMMFVTVAYPNLWNVLFGLVLVGTGMGFTIGTPLNYMMLRNTAPSESNSALAALSLVRSIGTAIAPAIMIGFVAHAGASLQDEIMTLLPKALTVPPLPYAQEIDAAFAELQRDEAMKEKLKGLTFPKLSELQKVELDFSGDSDITVPDALMDLMKSSDVTTVVANAKTFSAGMFDTMSPKLISDIVAGIEKGQMGITDGITEMAKAIEDMDGGQKGMAEGIAGMDKALKGQKEALTRLKDLDNQLTAMMAAVPKGMPTGVATGAPTGMPTGAPTGMPSGAPTGAPAGMPSRATIAPPANLAAMLPPTVKAQIPAAVVKELEAIKDQKALKTKINALEVAIETLTEKRNETKQSMTDLQAAQEKLIATKAELEALNQKMDIMKKAVPESFETAKQDYLKAIDARSVDLENAFQNTLNAGFKNVYLTTLLAGVVALLLLVFYSPKRMWTAEQ